MDLAFCVNQGFLILGAGLPGSHSLIGELMVNFLFQGLV